MTVLSDSDREEFLHIHRNLLLFTHNKREHSPSFKSVEDFAEIRNQEMLNYIANLREGMYQPEHLSEFCASTNVLNSDQIKLVKTWQYSYSDTFYIIQHLKAYSVLLTMNEKKLYGVLGIHKGLSEFFPKNALPVMVHMHLLPFKDAIIYDGYFGLQPLQLGSNISRELKQTYSKLKGLQGIITTAAKNVNLSEQKVQKAVDEQIIFQVKRSLKAGEFPSEAWSLAKGNEENEIVFDQAFAQYYAGHSKRSIQNKPKLLKKMFYAMYRDCIVGVSPEKDVLEAFCMKHYTDIVKRLYIFKA